MELNIIQSRWSKTHVPLNQSNQFKRNYEPCLYAEGLWFNILTDVFRVFPQPLKAYDKKYFRLTHDHLIVHPVHYSLISLLLETVECERLT
jgi:hypothetical protein